MQKTEAFFKVLFEPPRKLIVAWLILLCLALLFLGFRPSAPLETELSGAEGTEAWQVRIWLENQFQQRLGSSAAIVLPAEQAIDSLQARLQKRFPEIASLEKINSQAEHRLQILRIHFQPTLQVVTTQALTPSLRTEIKAWSQEHQSWGLLTGNTAFQHDAKVASKQDAQRSEGLALAISLLILVLNFGALGASLLPLLMGASCLLLLNFWVQFWGWSVNPVSRILCSLVGLALSIDYALFMVARFREESQHQSPHKALLTAWRQAGKTILFSGLIMICSLSALLLPDVSLSRTVMQQLIVVLLLAIAHSLLLLPALMLGMGHWLNWPQRLADLIRRYDSAPFWQRFSSHVVERAGVYFLLSVSLLLLLAWPVTRMRLWEPVQSIAPQQSESRLAYEKLQQDGWGGELLPVILAVPTPQRVFAADYLAYLYALHTHLESLPEVQRVQSMVSSQQDLKAYQVLYSHLESLGPFADLSALRPVVNLGHGENLSLLYVYPRNGMASEDTQAILTASRNYARQFSKYPLYTGGVVARVQDFTHELYRYTHWIIFWVFAGVFGLLCLHMRTPVLPLKAAFMNFLPILAAFGCLVRIFQEGWGQSWLHTPFNGAVTNTVPLVLFCLVFGLSMDYEVLMLSRVSEWYQRTGKVNEAIVQGLARSGAVITGAVLILLGVFIPGMFSSSPQTQEICIGIGLAILLDATIVRMFLVPSFMALLGRWNWWNPWNGKVSYKERLRQSNDLR